MYVYIYMYRLMVRLQLSVVVFVGLSVSVLGVVETGFLYSLALITFMILQENRYSRSRTPGHFGPPLLAPPQNNIPGYRYINTRIYYRPVDRPLPLK